MTTLVGLLLLFGGMASAQSLQVNFTASVDHARTTTAGVSYVTGYEMEVRSGTTLIKTTALGKPAPGAANAITVTVPHTPTLEPGAYTLRLLTVGPGGRTPAADVPFTVNMPPPGPPTNVTITVSISVAGDTVTVLGVTARTEP